MVYRGKGTTTSPTPPKTEPQDFENIKLLEEGHDAYYDIKTDDPQAQDKMLESYMLYILYILSDTLSRGVFRYCGFKFSTGDSLADQLANLRVLPGLSEAINKRLRDFTETILPIMLLCTAKGTHKSGDYLGLGRISERYVDKEHYQSIQLAMELFLKGDYDKCYAELYESFDPTLDAVKSVGITPVATGKEGEADCTLLKHRLYNSASKDSLEYVLATSLSCAVKSGGHEPSVVVQVSTPEAFHQMRYTYFFIPKQDKNKLRLIAAPKAGLKFTQKRLMEKLCSISSFDRDLLAYLPGKDYINTIKEDRPSRKYMMNFDIKNFFYNIDTYSGSLRAATGEIIKDAVGAYVCPNDNPLMRKLMGIVSDDKKTMLTWAQRESLDSDSYTYIYKLCKTMYRFTMNELGKSVVRTPFNKVMATNIVFSLLSTMEVLKLRRDMLASLETRPSGTSYGFTLSQWLFSEDPRGNNDEPKSFYTDPFVLEVLPIAGTFAACALMYDVDKRMLLAPIMKPSPARYSRKNRNFRTAVRAVNYYVKTSMLGMPMEGIGTPSAIGNMASRLSIGTESYPDKLLFTLASRLEKYTATSIPTRIDTALDKVAFDNRNKHVYNSNVRGELPITVLTRAFGSKVFSNTENKVDYRELCSSPDFRFAKVLNALKEVTAKKHVYGWRNCVPQGAPTSGVIVNYLNKHLLTQLRKRVSHIPNVINPKIYIYSDNIYVLYDLKDDISGIVAVEHHKEVKDVVADVCSDFHMPLNEDKESFFIGDKKILGLIVDKDGDVRVGRQRLIEVNQIIINLNKHDTIDYKGTIYTRGDLSRLRGLANWVKRGDSDKYPRKLIPLSDSSIA